MAEDINNNNNENGTENNQQQENTPKTYTEEEVLALIQSEADKRVNQALKTQQKKYEKQLSLSKLDTRSLMTIDNSLAESAGMVKTINVYTYSGEAEALANGVGNTAAKRGSITYTGTDHTVQMLQQAFDYTDEEAMKDPFIVDAMMKGATQVMANKLTSDFITACGSTSVTNFQFAQLIVHYLCPCTVSMFPQVLRLLAIAYQACIFLGEYISATFTSPSNGGYLVITLYIF